MEANEREEADALLARALEEAAASDPRDGYRLMLRELKHERPGDYSEAVQHFEDEVIPAIAEGRKAPLDAWIEFGTLLAERLRPGQRVVVDPSGRSTPLAGAPPDGAALVLHLPDEARQRALVITAPAEPTDAQSSTIRLLVDGKLRMDP